jgi:hypothetical protein
MTTIALAVATVFTLLALLHVHWALGGRTAWIAAVPEVSGRPAFVPGVGVTLLVAVALATCAVLVLATAGLIATPLPSRLLQIAMDLLGLVFLLRAFGDFRLVGVTKRVRGTRFARLDTLLYSPLCIALAVAVTWIATDTRN